MQSKALSRNSADLRADRELQLTQFIEAAIAGLAKGEGSDLILLARSPESLVCRAVFAQSASLEQNGISARIVLMAAAPGERWNLEFSPGFRHEMRLGVDHRLLDAHEQLVIGATSIWYGDSMRREPERRDAFTQFCSDHVEMARRGRMTFEALWAGCRPLYQRAAEQSVATAPASLLSPEAPIAGDIAASLQAWQPSTRN
ncbi:MAG: hypothetical protein ACKVP7_16545 [Hyphomicrobiaceae bacterium]